MTPNIDDMTYGEIKAIAGMFRDTGPAPERNEGGFWKIGKCYLIRTVTMAISGRLVALTGQEFVLEDAAWIADTGRFSDAIKACEFGEVEPFPDGHVMVGRGGLIDAVIIAKAQRVKK